MRQTFFALVAVGSLMIASSIVIAPKKSLNRSM